MSETSTGRAMCTEETTRITQLEAENARLHEQLDANLSAVDALLQQTARLANDMAITAPGRTFDAIGAGAGVGIRLTAIEDVRKALVTLGLRAHESRAASDEDLNNGEPDV